MIFVIGVWNLLKIYGGLMTTLKALRGPKMILYYKVNPIEFCDIIKMTDANNIHAEFIDRVDGKYNGDGIRVYIYFHKQRARYRIFYTNKNPDRVGIDDKPKTTVSLDGMMKNAAYNYLLTCATKVD